MRNISTQVRIRLSFLIITSLLLGLISLSPAANSLTTNLEIQAITDSNSGEVRLTFNSKIARAAVRSYQITATPNTPNAASYSKTFTRKVSGYVLQRVTSLTPGTDYKFRVSIRTTNNRVINSADFNFYTRSIKPTTPVITTAFETDSDEAVIYFDAPANDGQTPVLYYTATANPGNTTGITLQKGSGSITISGLTKSTTYTFTITAHNINGASVESRPSLPVTTLANKIIRVAPASSSGGSTLAAPAFTLSSSSQSVTVNSAITTVTNTPTGGTIASYAISPAAPAGLTFSNSTGQLSGTPTSTQSSTAYTITATNASGSATRTFTLRVTTTTPTFTLSRTTETRFVNYPLAGYTITETGAPITSYAISPTPPSPLTFDASTGRIAGTPSETRTATTYTITGTAASGETATATYQLRVTGDVGDTGPGGGVIFYRLAAGFNCGPTWSATCKYLEVAPSLWNGGGSDPIRTWAKPTLQSTVVNNASSPETTTATGIGWGYRNTRAIILQGNDDTATSAAALADSHTVTVDGVTFDDWYLPSLDELIEMYGQRSRIVGIATSGQFYWTSTEVDNNEARRVFFGNGDWATPSGKGASIYLRPIRAF